MRVPTKQIQELCDRVQLPPSAQKALTWIFRKSPGYGQPFIVDMHDFNKWQGKHRVKGKYCPANLGKIRDRLLELQIINVKRRWRGHIIELSILPIAGLLKEKNLSKKSTTIVKNRDCNLDRSNSSSESNTDDCDAGGGYKQQQHIIATTSLLNKSGFKFTKEVIYRIARYSAEAIARSIEYVRIKQTGRRPVVNPEGYLIDCLERGYWQGMRDRATDYWQEVVDNFKNCAVVLADKFKELPGIESSRIKELISILGEDYYGEGLVASAIAAYKPAKKTNPSLNRRRSGKGFGK